MKITALLQKISFLHKYFSHKPFIYVALGDSTVEGIGASTITKTYPAIINIALKSTYKKVEYHNFGKGRARVAGVIDSQLEKTIALQPHLITISIGANDIFKRSSVNKFSLQLDILLERLSKETNATIVINTIPDFSAVPSIPPVLKTYCKIQGVRFNKIIGTLTDQYKIVLVDFYTQTKILGKQYPELFASDGLHPSDIGYAIWAHAVLVKIENILEKKTGVEVNTETILPKETVVQKR